MKLVLMSCLLPSPLLLRNDCKGVSAVKLGVREALKDAHLEHDYATDRAARRRFWSGLCEDKSVGRRGAAERRGGDIIPGSRRT